jgi:AraC-like DNA-binding protein
MDVAGLHYMKPYLPAFSVHTLPHYEISIISEGSGFFTVGEQTHIVQSGDAVFIRPGEARNWDSKHIRNGYALIFEEEFILSFFNDRDFLHNLSFFAAGRCCVKISLSAETCRQVCQLMARIKTEISGTGNRHILRTLLYETLATLNRAYLNERRVLAVLPEENRKVKNSYVNGFLHLVNRQCTRQHSIRYYADQLSITPGYLNEVIKKSIGMNAKLYIRRQIVSEAKRLLIYTDMSISDIAKALSFESASYFVRFFRTHTLHTPLQYRNLSKTACGL